MFAQLVQVALRAQQEHAAVPQVTAAVEVSLRGLGIGLLDETLELEQVLSPRDART